MAFHDQLLSDRAAPIYDSVAALLEIKKRKEGLYADEVWLTSPASLPVEGFCSGLVDQRPAKGHDGTIPKSVSTALLLLRDPGVDLLFQDCHGEWSVARMVS